MKMPRSQCETENVQFVQELAEVDGPFEAPININFRDLTKLELPSLVWNRGDTCPKKMKITNTGHTVIVSGKWKCERPYLTGGPLLGKYVFSQIHFHWGQDDCKGSEHQICGEGFPLEMHVAHFKTEYMTQECALREKDGMVVLVYLFKLQDEPNQSLKKIINCLPNVKQPSTSHAIDPRPILSLCNPFTDDYFMYWGSVVTSTCAHILLWVICREPFGISKEQVNEFRKIMDSSQQPICRNSRDIQPLHKRNVFHVNASKHLDEPLLPIKKLLGCYCKGSEENEEVKDLNECQCRPTQNQEDVEGSFIEYQAANQGLSARGKKALNSKGSLLNSYFPNQTFFVHTAQVQSLTIVLKRSGSDPTGRYHCLNKLKKVKSEDFNKTDKKQVKYASQSFYFFPQKEVKKIKGLTEKRKPQERKRPFNSIKAFSQILHSLETLKNHTVKKLKEIESINQEIKEMKPFCQDTEDRKWIRKIENIMMRQRKFTLKSSQGCFSEIKKLAKDCNFDKFFDAKALSEGDRNKKVWMANDVTTNEGLPCFDNYMKGEGIPDMKKPSSKQFDLSKAIHFTSKAERLVQSFFEDIKESESLQETVKKDLNLKKIKSFYSKQEDSSSVINENKGYITQTMFTLGNLGSRFFTEVTAEDTSLNEKEWEYKKIDEEVLIADEVSEAKNILDKYETEKTISPDEPELAKDHAELKSKNELLISSQRPNNALSVSKTNVKETKAVQALGRKESFLNKEEKLISNMRSSSNTGLESSNKDLTSAKKAEKNRTKKSPSVKYKKITDLISDKMYSEMEAKVLLARRSISDLSTESTETQRMIIAKIRESRKEFWEQKRRKSSSLLRVSSKRLYNKSSSKKFEGYYTQKKSLKLKKRKSHRSENVKKSLYGMSSTSKEESNLAVNKQKWKRMTKPKIKVEKGKTSDSTSEPGADNFLLSPQRKKLKLEAKKLRDCSSLDSFYPSENNKVYLTDTETRTLLTNPSAEDKEEALEHTGRQNPEQKDSAEKSLEEVDLEKQEKEKLEADFKIASRTSTNRTFRASSIESQVSLIEEQNAVEQKECELSDSNNRDLLKREIFQFTNVKLLTKNRSLTHVTNMPSLTAKFTQKIYADSINRGIKNNKDPSLPRNLPESPNKFQENLKNGKAADLVHEISDENYQKVDIPQESQRSNQNLESHLQTSSKLEYEVGFFTTTSSQVDDELLPTNQLEKDKVLIWGDAETNRFPAREPHQLKLTFHKSSEKHPEILPRTDSNKSFGKDSSKANVDPLTVDNKDLQISVSCSTLKKNPTSRPHSAESLLSQTKPFKRKSKKRPHCCKRISRHYIRKSSSIFKKPSKTEKQSNFFNLADEEQLKIISENVAKYLKEKLEVENKTSDSKSSLNNIEEVFTNLKITEEKVEKQIVKETVVEKPDREKNLDKKPYQAPADKKTEKKEKQKRPGILNKPKVIKTPIQVRKEKSDISPPKPANNFIKLNKQMAGKYKRLLPPMVKKVESKEKIKANQESKTKGQKKKTENSPVPKTQDQVCSSPETPASNKNSKLSPKKTSQKESHIKSPKNYKKPDSPVKKSNDRPESPAVAKRSSQMLKCESKSKEILAPPSPVQKSPPLKKCLIPTYTLTTHFPPHTDLVENQKKKMSACLLSVSGTNSNTYHSDTKTEGEIDSEVLLRKELEYFIKLQMCKNNETSENSLDFVTSKAEQDNQSNLEAKDSLSQVDSSNKGVVLVEKKDLVEYSTSGSELAEESTQYSSIRDETGSGNIFKSEDIVTVKTPCECGNSKGGVATVKNEKQEETNSDSSYDCKISITLNTNPNTNEESSEVQNPYSWMAENSNKLIPTCLKESSSQSTVTKQQPKKRNDTDISLEMKQKLFEILEGEIKREIGITCGSSGTSSDGLTFKGEDSDGNNRSQSTESSCDNLEVLAQISNTMRQYLAYLKEMKQSSDKECKDYDES